MGCHEVKPHEFLDQWRDRQHHHANAHSDPSDIRINAGVSRFRRRDGGAAQQRWILIGIAVVVSIGLAIWALRAGGRLIPVACGLIIGGALGNAWDRITYGAVADFLNMSCCGIDNPFVFNVADTAIFLGAVALILMPSKGQKA
ncbi:MAG: signal peptidase II [Pseudomonadota bacterium]